MFEYKNIKYEQRTIRPADFDLDILVFIRKTRV